MSYEYATRELEYASGSTGEDPAELVDNRWRRVWADVTTDGIFAVYRREILELPTVDDYIPDVWCVKYRDGKRDGWCATKSGRRPSDDALNDPTECGHVVNLRIGSKLGMPTCQDCLQLLVAKART